jgi:uncharacterized protein (DUF488 family)
LDRGELPLFLKKSLLCSKVAQQVSPRVVSVGYGGRRVAAFIECLAAEQVEVLVDVRLRAASGIPGFSGQALANALSKVGIEYRHAPSLGNPPENRAPFHDGSLVVGRRRFLSVLAEDGGREELQKLAQTLGSRCVAILCAERDQLRCHRHVVIDELKHLMPKLEVTVLD